MAETALRFLVRGRVQGVFFRASTQDQARMLALRGYTRNLADGRVEVVACGEQDALESLHAWLQHGPPLARVDAVDREPAVLPELALTERFEVRRG